MIKIIRPTTTPDKLKNEGEAANKKNCLDYDADPNSYMNGTSSIDIDNSIYGHSSIKRILKKAQHNKCCFCEKDQVDEFGAVEHFRPKKGYKSTEKDKLKKPGYYWLGYNWNNLFFVCSACNSAGNKGNLFPLLDESKRAKSHHDKVSDETPLLLDPCGPEDPRDHIYFDDEFPKSKSALGANTIEICGLDRDALNEKRKKLIADIDVRIVIIASKMGMSKTETDKAKDYLLHSTQPTSEFSSSATDYIQQFL